MIIIIIEIFTAKGIKMWNQLISVQIREKFFCVVDSIKIQFCAFFAASFSFPHTFVFVIWKKIFFFIWKFRTQLFTPFDFNWLCCYISFIEWAASSSSRTKLRHCREVFWFFLNCLWTNNEIKLTKICFIWKAMKRIILKLI